MKRVLLVGRDPLFAWALEKTITAQGHRLEHVYTVAEATLRMNRFHYDLCLLDGLSEEEIGSFPNLEDESTSIFVLDDREAEKAGKGAPGAHRIPKEGSLSSILATLRDDQ